MKKHLQVTISAEDEKQVEDILNALLEKKLVTGGLIINAPAKFLWKGEITDMNYYNINSFTTDNHKEEIIDVVKKISIEEVPMVSFIVIEGNKELLNWIEQTVN